MLTAYARFIREKYALIIISTLVLGIVVGLFTPAPGMATRKISSILIITMIGAMGFTITFKSLGRAATAIFLMFMAINTAMPAIMKNLRLIGPLVASTVLIFPTLFLVAYLISIKLLPRGKNIAITFSSGMKNMPIAVGIAVMSFKGLVMLPIAVALAFQMLTAVSFYQLFLKTLPDEISGKGGPPGKVSESRKENNR